MALAVTLALVIAFVVAKTEQTRFGDFISSIGASAFVIAILVIAAALSLGLVLTLHVALGTP